MCIIAAGTLLTSCTRTPQNEYLRGNTMGTSYTVHYQNSTNSAESLQLKIDTLLNEFEEQLSNWRPHSWVSQFNAAPIGQAVPIPAHAFHVLRLCLILAEQSQGALDPTVSPLVELWGFGTHRNQTVPSPAAIDLARHQVGYHHLILDTENSTLQKTRPELQLNCSAVAKGYAVDLVARLLLEDNTTDFLINIGGEVFVQGASADGTPWGVAIRPPDQSKKPPTHFALTDQAMATSGHTERIFFAAGQRYSHILDPRTGYPVDPIIASATIIAPTCALADGLATLALVLNEAEMTAVLTNYPHVKLIRKPWND